MAELEQDPSASTSRKLYPLEEVGLAAGVEELTTTTAQLHETVKKDYRLRQIRWVIVTVGVILFALQDFYGYTLYNKLTKTQDENHRLLKIVTNVTSGEVAKQQSANTQALVRNIILCVDNYIDVRGGVVGVLTPGCPVPTAGQPAALTPPSAP